MRDEVVSALSRPWVCHFFYRPRWSLTDDCCTIQEFDDRHPPHQIRQRAQSNHSYSLHQDCFSQTSHEPHALQRASLERDIISWGLRQNFCPPSLHLICMRFGTECCETINIVRIDGYIFGKEFCVVFGHHGNISNEEDFRKFWDITTTDIIENSQEWITSASCRNCVVRTHGVRRSDRQTLCSNAYWPSRERQEEAEKSPTSTICILQMVREKPSPSEAVYRAWQEIDHQASKSHR